MANASPMANGGVLARAVSRSAPVDGQQGLCFSRHIQRPYNLSSGSVGTRIATAYFTQCTFSTRGVVELVSIAASLLGRSCQHRRKLNRGSLTARVQGTARHSVSDSGAVRRNLLIGHAIIGAAASDGAGAEAGDRAPPNLLLEANPVMKKFTIRFLECQRALEQSNSLDSNLVAGTILTILELFSSNVWDEVGPIGARERDIWRSVDPPAKGAALKRADVRFLRDYYSFWGVFNNMFDVLLLRMDPTLPGVRERLITPSIPDLVSADQQVGAFGGKVASLPGLFAEIQRSRGNSRKSIEYSASAIASIRTFCQDGKYMDGLGALIDTQVELLGFLQALGDGKAPKESLALKALGMWPQTSNIPDSKARAVQLLYQMQGVFLFVNQFQEEVLTSLGEA